MSDRERLNGKVALVTGASRGLGAGIADALAAAGARVVGTSRAEASATRIAEGLGSPAVVMDVTDVASIRAGVAKVAAELGGIDVLVNNAGVNVPQPLLDVDEPTWDLIIDTNLKGTLFVAQAVAADMIRRGGGGRIVNVTSQAGEVGIEERSAYGASKGGAGILTKVLALELAEHGIGVNAVAPTFVDTELGRRTLADPEWRARVLSRIPLGRVATVADVAAAVLFLAGPESAMVTGHTLLVDGGWTAR